MTQPWVLSQRRTMSRWVTSKINREIHDISVDLCDGLALLELVNTIAAETNASSYRLTPVHRKPRIPLQKLENVADVLDFCRLLLQVHMCNISAEDVVSGNTKLILGLVWSLFVYSLANMVSIKSESRSFAEIKHILLRWLNITGKVRALSEIANFNTDWSLQQGKRPDLVFAAILDFYLPNLIDYKKLLVGRRLSGLKEIVALAQASLGIPDLALAEDFNVLVPDEKCIISYVLEWYLFFEVHKKEIPLDLILKCRGAQECQNHDFGPFFLLILRAVKLKNLYDTKSLRLLNQLNGSMGNIQDCLKTLRILEESTTLEELVDNFCAEIDDKMDLEEQLSCRNSLEDIVPHVKCLQEILKKSMKFKHDTKPSILYRDIPELQNLSKSLNFELKIGGLGCSYEPPKALALEFLLDRVRHLLEADMQLYSRIDGVLKRLFATSIRNIDLVISFVAKALPRADKHASKSVHEFTADLELLIELRLKMHEYQLMVKQEHTISDLKILANSIAFYDLPATPLTPEESQFQSFQTLVKNLGNQTNLTLVDIKKFFRTLMPASQFNGPELQGIILLIPSRCYLLRSESHEFDAISHLDDSDDTDAIFDSILKTLECKLLGAQGKIYDLALLVHRMESGFNI